MLTRKKRMAPNPQLIYGSGQHSLGSHRGTYLSPHRVEKDLDTPPTPPPKMRGTIKFKPKRPPPPPPPVCVSPNSEAEDASSGVSSTRLSPPASPLHSGNSSPSVDDSGVNSDSDRPRSSASSRGSSQLRSGGFSRISQESLQEDHVSESVDRTLQQLTALRDEMLGPPPPPEFSDFWGSEPLSLVSIQSAASSQPSPPASHLDLIQSARSNLKKPRHDRPTSREAGLEERLKQSLTIAEYRSPPPKFGAQSHESADLETSEAFAGVRFAPEVTVPEAGFKDITIRSKRGTIRGVKNRVRQGIATFLRDPCRKNFPELEKGKVVVYMTTLGVLRDTYARCVKVRQILRTHLIKVEERDVFMSKENQLELLERTDQLNLEVPKVFVEGRYLGDAETIENLNEQGELKHILKPYKCYSVTLDCQKCGGFRMLPCQVCSGSKKSLHRNNFTEYFVALRCSHCDDSALVKCDQCSR